MADRAHNRTMPLEREFATFKQKLPEFKDQEGRFVLIHGDDVVDFFSTYEDAIKEGYQRFGLESFLVKRLAASERPHFVSRFLQLATIGPDLSSRQPTVLG